MAINAYLNLILNKEAAMAPVQAPVTGSGMATNITSPNASYFWTVSALFLVRSKSQSKKRDQILNFLSLLETGSNKKSRGTTGIMLPNTDNVNALVGGIPKDNAKGIAPLNSDTGNAPTIITTHSLGISFSEFNIISNISLRDTLSFSWKGVPILGDRIRLPEAQIHNRKHQLIPIYLFSFLQRLKLD